jgi:hypothetical protein
MDTVPMTPAQRLHGARAYGRAANAFDSIAWRAPGVSRFENRAANDPAEGASARIEPVSAQIPGWLIVVGGGVIAALTGAMLGGMLAV